MAVEPSDMAISVIFVVSFGIVGTWLEQPVKVKVSRIHTGLQRALNCSFVKD